MALGGVSIVPFTTAELTENFGTVSTVPCTRAEIVKMFKEKMNPYGKVVWSGAVTVAVSSGAYLGVPDTVDYIKVNGVMVARENSSQVLIAAQSGMYSGTVSTSVSFKNGTLSFSSLGIIESSATHYVKYQVYLNCTGYQYY